MDIISPLALSLINSQQRVGLQKRNGYRGVMILPTLPKMILPTLPRLSNTSRVHVRTERLGFLHAATRVEFHGLTSMPLTGPRGERALFAITCRVVSRCQMRAFSIKSDSSSKRSASCSAHKMVSASACAKRGLGVSIREPS